jgi:hypothetical protein
MIPQIGESFYERNLNPAPDVSMSTSSASSTAAAGEEVREANPAAVLSEDAR